MAYSSLATSMLVSPAASLAAFSQMPSPAALRLLTHWSSDYRHFRDLGASPPLSGGCTTRVGVSWPRKVYPG